MQTRVERDAVVPSAFQYAQKIDLQTTQVQKMNLWYVGEEMKLLGEWGPRWGLEHSWILLPN